VVKLLLPETPIASTGEAVLNESFLSYLICEEWVHIRNGDLLLLLDVLNSFDEHNRALFERGDYCVWLA
jgi:hypothetical protein